MAAAIEAGIDRLFQIGGAHAVARWPTAPGRCRAWTRLSARATNGWRRQKRWSAATARSISTPGRPRFSSSPRADRRAGLPRILIAQAEHDPDARAILVTTNRRLAERRAREPWSGCATRRSGARVARSTRRRSSCAAIMRERCRSPTKRRRSTWSSRTKRWRRRSRRRGRVCRSLDGPSRRRLRDRIQSRAADGRRGAVSRRPQRRRFRPPGVGSTA